MRKLKLANVAHLAEIIAAVAVVTSLLYVGREVQANTAAIRGASLQAVTGAQAELLLTQAGDSALARIRQIGDQDPTALSAAEAYRYTLVVRQTWINLQNVYFQHELELIDARIWGVYHRIICDIWLAPGAKDTWPRHQRVLDPAFIELVESCTDA